MDARSNQNGVGRMDHLLFEAQLFGGLGNGLTIKLQEFVPQVTIFRNGGPAVAVPGNVEAEAYPDGVRLGVYELAGPVGPDTPIYVSR
jgi:hypothetical protein